MASSGSWGDATFPDNAADWQKLGIKRNTVAQHLNQIIHLITQHDSEGQLQTFTNLF